MDKLIIVCCIHQEGHVFPPEAMVNMPRGMQAVAQSVRESRDAGAAVAHCHGVTTKNGVRPDQKWDEEGYLELNRLIRETDVIFEHRGPPSETDVGWRGELRDGVYTYSDVTLLAERRRELQQIKNVPLPDSVHILLGPQHMDYGFRQYYVMPIIKELEESLKHLHSIGVKPHFECEGALSLHNLRRMIELGVVDAPYWLDLAMGTLGSTYPPSTVEELLYFTKHLPDPEHSVWHTWYFAPPKGSLPPQEGLAFFAHTIAMGGHVRVGMEDTPYYWDGSPVKSNAQLVESIVRLARDIGREVATPDEARQMLGMPLPRRK